MRLWKGTRRRKSVTYWVALFYYYLMVTYRKLYIVVTRAKSISPLFPQVGARKGIYLGFTFLAKLPIVEIQAKRSDFIDVLLNALVTRVVFTVHEKSICSAKQCTENFFKSGTTESEIL